MVVRAIITAAALMIGPATASAQVASYYADQHNGRRTASGERFNMRALTAAHRTLPFGTHVEVCLRGCVVVRINDRGPAAWTGRSIDLSKEAARRIGMIRRGVGKVRVRVMR